MNKIHGKQMFDPEVEVVNFDFRIFFVPKLPIFTVRRLTLGMIPVNLRGEPNEFCEFTLRANFAARAVVVKLPKKVIWRGRFQDRLQA